MPSNMQIENTIKQIPKPQKNATSDMGLICINRFFVCAPFVFVASQCVYEIEIMYHKLDTVDSRQRVAARLAIDL